MPKYHQGLFKPKNPKKYNGDATNIVYRSGWELAAMRKFDLNPSIIWWASEEIQVNYRSPLDNRIHRYYPDFIIKKKSVDGKLSIVMIEIKPEYQTKPPVRTEKKKEKRFLQEVMTWGINEAKWKSALAYCKSRGWQFLILSERHLGIK